MSNRKMSYALFFLSLFLVVGCRFSNRPFRNEVNKSDASSVFLIKDSDWELRLIQALPKESAPDQIRCNQSGYCWSWNLKSIWLAEDNGRWRQVYILPSQQREKLETIENVSMISSQTGWFITHKALYQTRDGGVSWSPASGPVCKNGCGFWSIFFLDDKFGWIVGGEFRPRLAGEPVVNNATSGDGNETSVATIWQTTDGGATWQAKDLSRLVGRFTHIQFWGARGVAFGDAGCVFTDNGGTSWRKLTDLIPRQSETGEMPEVTGAYFVNPNSGWIFTSWLENLSTSNGGKTWTVLPSKLSSGSGNAKEIVPSNAAFADENRGLLIAGPAGTGKLFKTVDSGKNWVEIVSGEKIYDVTLVGEVKGFLLGDKGIYSISLRRK